MLYWRGILRIVVYPFICFPFSFPAVVQEVLGISNIAYAIYRISYTPGNFTTTTTTSLGLLHVLMTSLILVLHYYHGFLLMAIYLASAFFS